MKYFIMFLWLSLAGAVALFLGNGPAKPDQEKSAKTFVAAGDLFTNLAVVRVQIDIPNAGLALLGGTRWGNGAERPTVKATVREGEKVYANVAVHLKGAAGSFRNVYDHPCLTLNFDKFTPGQNFHGLTKISLNNSVQDGSYLSEKICRELFEAAGVPVPRAGHAKVKLNGRDLGLYVLTEGFNKQFLKRYFKNTKGNLYDGGFVQDINQGLKVNSGDNPEIHPGMNALMDAVREQNPTNRLARLEKVLDMDRFMSFIAMEALQCHWDGYAQNINNWRLFHDLESNKMVFMPHGLDQMFGAPRERGSPNDSIDPRRLTRGVVSRAILNTQEGRRRYFEKIGQLYTNVFKVDALLKRVDEVAAVIRPVIAESNMQWGRSRDFDGQVNWLKDRIRQRGESLRSQLNTAAAPLKVETAPIVRPTGWQQRVIAGNANFLQQRQDGNTMLYIGAPNGDVNASWRTKVTLGPGNYRFEGKIRTRNVRPSAVPPGTGAGLRTHLAPVPQQFSGSVEWQNFVFPFQVQEGGEEVQLICELQASKGEAWFDTSSLRVVRIR